MIADNVGVIANKVFALGDPTFPILWAGVFAFAIQIYADFSAYTDIARGTSRWLGFELTENFDHPYLARTPADFWRRWNISLVELVPRLRLHPARRIEGRRGEMGAQRAGHVPAVRPVARRQLELRALGRLSRRPARAHARAGSSSPRRRSPADARRDLRPDRHAAQIAGMFALTLFGWLLFRETELSAIVRALTLSPFSAPADDRSTGLYLFLLTLLYSMPLWAQSIWVEWHRDEAGSVTRPSSCRRLAPRRASGRRLRPRLRGDPAAAQPRVAGFHLLSVLVVSVQFPVASSRFRQMVLEGSGNLNTPPPPH